MLQACAELSFVLISVYPGMHSYSICLPILPLSNVRIPSCAFPHARAMLAPIHPLPLIRLSIRPDINAYSLRFPIHKISLVLRVVAEPLIPLPMLKVILPNTLIHPTIIVDHHPVAMPLTIQKLSIIHTLFVTLCLGHCRSMHLRDIEVRLSIILLKVLKQLLGIELSLDQFLYLRRQRRRDVLLVGVGLVLREGFALREGIAGVGELQ